MNGYSVLTHEEVVDLVWADQIQPLLRHRFPGASDEELEEAHAYACGGCVIQDLGYYPFGNKQFSDIVHYVRSGDFVVALLRDANDLDGYAFALGSLAHYVSDVEGHPSVNRAVAIEYPKLRKKFGDSVTYQDNHRAHIRNRVRLRRRAGGEEPVHLRQLPQLYRFSAVRAAPGAGIERYLE